MPLFSNFSYFFIFYLVLFLSFTFHSRDHLATITDVIDGCFYNSTIKRLAASLFHHLHHYCPSHSIPLKHAGNFFPCPLSFITGSPKILIFGERRKCGNSLEERGFSTCCKPLPTRTSFFRAETIYVIMWTTHNCSFGMSETLSETIHFFALVFPSRIIIPCFCKAASWR